MNRRLMYSRASADPEGKPWSERKRYVWWDEEKKTWTGYDVPDFIASRPPSYRPPPDASGTATISGIDPFIMNSDGKGWLFAPAGLLDGPLPTHYEPMESPVQNLLYRQQCNPARLEWIRKGNPYHLAFGDPRFPYVITTYRLTEHHTAGGMSRWLSWLSELQPEMFCEVSPELAAERGLELDRERRAAAAPRADVGAEPEGLEDGSSRRSRRSMSKFDRPFTRTSSSYAMKAPRVICTRVRTRSSRPRSHT